MGCCASCCAKCCLSFCNFLVMMIGTILMLFGALLLWGWGTVSGVLGPMLNGLTAKYNLSIANMNPSSMLSIISNVGWALFIIGVILMAIAVLGWASVCCSCCKLCSIVYIAVLSTFLLAEIIFIIVYFAAQPQFASMAKTYMLQLIQQYYVDVWQLSSNFNIVAFLYNLMMVNMQCCGVNNYTDYQQSPYWNRTFVSNGVNTTMVIPYACCVMTSTSSYVSTYTNCTTNPMTSSAYLNSNCYSALTNSFASYLNIIIGVLGGLGGLLLLPIALTLCICSSGSSSVGSA